MRHRTDGCATARRTPGAAAIAVAVGLLLAPLPGQAMPPRAVSATGGARVPPSRESLDGDVRALLEMGPDALVVGGEFTSVDQVQTHNVAQWTPGGWLPMGLGFDAPVRALAELDGAVVAGGDFLHSGSTAVNHVARWNGSAWEPLGSGTDGPVHALIVQAGVVLYAGGGFTHAGGLPANSVARWVGNAWTPLGLGLGGVVHALAFQNGGLVAGGEFTILDPGVVGSNLARFISGVWRTPALGLDGPIYALANYNGALVMAGHFAHADLVTPARNIAGLISDWNSIGFGFGPGDSTDTSEVHALAVVGGNLVAGGVFDVVDLKPIHNITSFDGTGWQPLGAGTDGDVQALAPFTPPGAVVAGGAFAHAGGAPLPYLAGYLDPNWFALVGDPVYVEDLAVETTGDGEVHLSWRLARDAVASLAGVDVQRAPAAAGPFTRRTDRPLAPAAAMAFAEPFESREPWYRLAILQPNGTVAFVGPIAARGDARVGRLALFAPRDPGGGEPVAIEYELPAAALAQLDLFDVRGHLVRRLASGPELSGRHLRAWDRRDGAGADAARGVYFLQLRADGATATRKLVLARP